MTAPPPPAGPPPRDRRRLVRRIVFLASVPLVLFAVLLGVKVLSMYASAYAAAAAYVAEDFPGTVEAARGQEPVNVFEPYKAPFNVGVGLAASGRLEEARAAFEEALALAPGLEQCAVRVNLAIVIERIGDAALAEGDRTAATAAWQEALFVMQEAPEECRTPEANEVSPDPEQNLEDTIDEELRRLLEKLQDPTGGTPPPEDPEQAETPEDSELDDIQDQLDQGAEEREEYESGDDDGYGGTDRPW